MIHIQFDNFKYSYSMLIIYAQLYYVKYFFPLNDDHFFAHSFFVRRRKENNNKFDHTNKWYMHNPASVLGNDTHKLLGDLDKQTGPIISARRPDIKIINNNKKKKKEKKEN